MCPDPRTAYRHQSTQHADVPSGIGEWDSQDELLMESLEMPNDSVGFRLATGVRPMGSRRSRC